jgi:transcriptional regulator with XRE-family HTH domain
MPRTPVGDAVLRLRQHLQLSQERFAQKLGVSMSSTVRFEIYQDPGPRSLARLADLARNVGCPDIAAVFDDALAQRYGSVAPGRVAELVRAQASGRINEPCH